MRSVIQVVKDASITVNDQTIANIEAGIVALIGFEKTDTLKTAEKLLDRILNYRIFPDHAGKTNLSLRDIKGWLLLVPQFTLVAETNKGTRPGFSIGMEPEKGKIFFSDVVKLAESKYSNLAHGEFGAYMQVRLCNDGPMTFILSAS